MMRLISIIVAAVVLVLGLIPLLFNLGIIGFGLGFITVNWYYILFVIEGLFLVIAAFAMQ